jgi:alpha-tubulin suppressor-like RCC1 family protein
VQVVGIDNATAICAGNEHNCALLQDGTVSCWGYNGSYQLGSTTPTRSGTPMAVAGVQGATAVACGQYFTCALSGGAVFCWGSNYVSGLGQGVDFSVLKLSATPLPVVGVTTAVSLAAGPSNACVILADGSVQCWGGGSPTPQTISGITGPTALTIGEYHFCGLLSDGTVKCWGDDSEGQLGDGHSAGQSATPLAVVGLTGATAIAAGLGDTCAIAGDGLVRCWGFGGLGNGGTASSESDTPVVVMGLPDAMKLPANAGDNNGTGCAIRADGSIACWGSNYDAMLGVGSSVNYGQTALPVTATW